MLPLRVSVVQVYERWVQPKSDTNVKVNMQAPLVCPTNVIASRYAYRIKRAYVKRRLPDVWKKQKRMRQRLAMLAQHQDPRDNDTSVIQALQKQLKTVDALFDLMNKVDGKRCHVSVQVSTNVPIVTSPETVDAYHHHSHQPSDGSR